MGGESSEKTEQTSDQYVDVKTDMEPIVTFGDTTLTESDAIKEFARIKLLEADALLTDIQIKKLQEAAKAAEGENVKLQDIIKAREGALVVAEKKLGESENKCRLLVEANKKLELAVKSNGNAMIRDMELRNLAFIADMGKVMKRVMAHAVTQPPANVMTRKYKVDNASKVFWVMEISLNDTYDGYALIYKNNKEIRKRNFECLAKFVGIICEKRPGDEVNSWKVKLFLHKPGMISEADAVAIRPYDFDL